MIIRLQYDLTNSGCYTVVAWKWVTREDRPNAPEWWHGGYSKNIRLFRVPLAVAKILIKAKRALRK